MKRIFVIFFIFAFAGCSNIFQAPSKKDSDEALFEDAIKYQNSGDCTSALANFAKMSTNFLARTEVKSSWIGAYACDCGFRFDTYISSFNSGSTGGSAILLFLMSAWTQKVVKPASCTTAETKMNEIGAAAINRTSDQNLFMLFLAMAKIGVYLRDNADRDSTDSLGDGTADAGFDACSSTSISDNAVAEIGSGLGQIIDNFATITAILSNSSDIYSSLDALQTACGSNCSTDASAIKADAAKLKVLRTIINTNTYGIQSGAPCP